MKVFQRIRIGCMVGPILLQTGPLPNFVLIGEAELIHEAGTLFIDPGATWSDDRDGSGEVDSQTSFDSGTPEFIPYPMNFSDATGNPAQPVSRTIYVIDLTGTDLTGEAIVRIEAGTDYLDGGATWTDAGWQWYLTGTGRGKEFGARTVCFTLRLYR